MKYSIGFLLMMFSQIVMAQTNTFPASGNVGVGTLNPLTPMHIIGGSAMTAGWNKTSTLQATFPVQIFNSNNTKWAGIGYDFSTAMRFWVNSPNEDLPGYGTHGMTIWNNGNVGIGTGNPKTLLHLHQPSNSDTYLHLTNEVTGSQLPDGLEISANADLGSNIWNYENN